MTEDHASREKREAAQVYGAARHKLFLYLTDSERLDDLVVGYPPSRQLVRAAREYVEAVKAVRDSGLSIDVNSDGCVIDDLDP
ncbi:hypothetical protein QM616_11340 [Rhodococcus fascians]|uniref:hypothetical protein n=1 Tax=Rhodococcoides fascians TaxID=1828 RepID=UPI0024B7340C|nr:hypothetical protein [Rhodococcus fascians]MDJ0003310.1 hypothetical protein [Rhodococcus fascians]